MSPDPSQHPLRLAREAKGLRLQDLAEKIGKSASMLSNVERNFRPKLQTQIKIAKALDCSLSDLWPDEYDEDTQ